MKNTLCLLGLLFLLLMSCDQEVGSLPEPEAEHHFEIRFTPTFYDAIMEYEVLISQEDGAVLADTLLKVPGDHLLQVTSPYEKVNITTVAKFMDIEPSFYSINTLVQVNPDKWNIRINYQDFYRVSAPPERPMVRSKIRYVNLPMYWDPADLYSGVYFAAPNSIIHRENHGSDYIEKTYDRTLPSSLTYLLLPELGKYFLKEVTTDQVTLDYAEAKNVIKHNFSEPKDMTLWYISLTGYPKAGVYKDPLALFSSQLVELSYKDFKKPSHHLMYPQEAFEEYELSGGVYDADSNLYTHYSIVKEVPTALSLVKKPHYNLTHTSFNDVRVDFPTQAPTHYQLLWSAESSAYTTKWLVQLPPELMAFNSEDFLKRLNPILLRDQHMNDFDLQYFSVTNATGFNYQDFFSYVFNLEELKKKKLKQYIRFRAAL